MSESNENETGQSASNNATSAAGTGGNDTSASQGGYQGLFYSEEPPPPQVQQVVRRRSPKPSPLILGGFALVAAALVALLLLHHPSGDTPSSDSQDLGDGIYKPAGLRGHMLVRWDGKLHYQVQIEPIDPTMESGFDFVLSNPPRPMALTVHLVDSSGFGLCQKDIVIPFNPAQNLSPVAAEAPRHAGKAALARWQQEASARKAQLTQAQLQEQTRERGQDLLQKQVDSNGKIIALNAEGDIPCPKSAFKHVDYWVITTNFPTLDEQQALMDHRKEQAAQRTRAAVQAAKQKFARRMNTAFYMQGDEHVSSYDPTRTMLNTSPGRSFVIARKSDQAIAASWAAGSALVHYKCDQQASCVLTHSGTSSAIYGRVNE